MNFTPGKVNSAVPMETSPGRCHTSRRLRKDSIPTDLCFTSPTSTAQTSDMMSLTSSSMSSSRNGGRTEQQALTENKVRAFLVDYYEDCSTLTGKSEECWKAFYGKTHMPHYKLVESSGDPIDNETLIGSIALGNVTSNTLVSVDSVTLLAGGKVAVANYTTECQGEENAVFITTAIIAEIDGEPKIVQEHRSECQPIPKEKNETRWSSGDANESTNTIPNDDVPVAPGNAVNGRWYCESDDLEKESAGRMPVAESSKEISDTAPSSTRRAQGRRSGRRWSQADLVMLEQKNMKRIGSRDKLMTKPTRSGDALFGMMTLSSIDPAMSKQGNATWGAQQNATVSPSKKKQLFQDIMASPVRSSRQTNRLLPHLSPGSKDHLMNDLLKATSLTRNNVSGFW
jgi:hypothetical protein